MSDGRAVITAMLHGDADEAHRILEGDGSPEHAAYMLTYLSTALTIMAREYANSWFQDPVEVWQEECLRTEHIMAQNEAQRDIADGQTTGPMSVDEFFASLDEEND